MNKLEIGTYFMAYSVPIEGGDLRVIKKYIERPKGKYSVYTEGTDILKKMLEPYDLLGRINFPLVTSAKKYFKGNPTSADVVVHRCETSLLSRITEKNVYRSFYVSAEISYGKAYSSTVCTLYSMAVEFPVLHSQAIETMRISLRHIVRICGIGIYNLAIWERVDGTVKLIKLFPESEVYTAERRIKETCGIRGKRTKYLANKRRYYKLRRNKSAVLGAKTV